MAKVRAYIAALTTEARRPALAFAGPAGCALESGHPGMSPLG
jgi:hypothetical protein